MKKPTEIWKIIWPILLKHYKRDKTFLDYKTNFQLLIAVIMSAQTTDEGVNKVTPRLWKKYPKPADLAKANPRDVEEIIHAVGYFRAKTQYITKTAQMILKDFKGVVPNDEALLRTLPGVGRKTAVAVLTNAFNKNIGIPVDTHVIRFVKRFHLSRQTNPDRIEKELLEIIPQKNWRAAGYAIKQYGHTDGKARGWKPELDPVWVAYQRNK
jgi:endonuclease-3